jgi:hypothetical protein
MLNPSFQWCLPDLGINCPEKMGFGGFIDIIGLVMQARNQGHPPLENLF